MSLRESVLQKNLSARILGLALTLGGIYLGYFETCAALARPVVLGRPRSLSSWIWMAALLVYYGGLFLVLGKDSMRFLAPADKGKSTTLQTWTFALGIVFSIGVAIGFEWILPKLGH